MTTPDPTTPDELVAYLAASPVVRQAVAAATDDLPTTPEEAFAWVRDWLAAMPPRLRGLVAGVLVDNRHKPELAAVRQEAVAQLATNHSYAEVAEQLHVGTSAVGHAITAHNKRHTAQQTA